MHQIFQLHALLHHFSCFKSFSILTFKLTFFSISLQGFLPYVPLLFLLSRTRCLFFSFTLCFAMLFSASLRCTSAARCFPPRYCAVLLLVSSFYRLLFWLEGLVATTRSWFVIMIFPYCNPTVIPISQFVRHVCPPLASVRPGCA